VATYDEKSCNTTRLIIYKYKGIGSCGGFSGGGFSTVTTMFSGRDG